MSTAFGGTPLRGITYTAKGSWAILVSSQTGHDAYGYRDGWLDAATTRYRYSGEWNGCGDMGMTRGNAAVRDRSPELFLFIKESDGYVYRGRFAVHKFDLETARNPRCGHNHAAIRFELVRAQ